MTYIAATPAEAFQLPPADASQGYPLWLLKRLRNGDFRVEEKNGMSIYTPHVLVIPGGSGRTLCNVGDWIVVHGCGRIEVWPDAHFKQTFSLVPEPSETA